MSTPSPSGNRFERHSGKITVLVWIVFLVAALALAEWLLAPRGGRHASRALSDSPVPARHLIMREWRRETDYLYAPPPARGLFKDDGYSNAYRLSTDADGYILPSARHAKADVEVVFLGGSTTECMFVSPEKRFPHLAAVKLEAATRLRINGLNGGRSGNTTMHANALLLAKVLPRRPDFVVLMEAVNDIGILKRDGYWIRRGGQRLVESERVSVGEGAEMIVKSLIPYTFAAILQAKRVLSRPRQGDAAALEATMPARDAQQPATAAPGPEAAPSTAAGALPAAWQAPSRDFEASLRTFVRTVSAWGAEPVLMTQVRVRTKSEAERRASFLRNENLAAAGLGDGDLDVLHDHFNAVVRKVAAEERAVLIDLAAAHDWRFGDVYDQIHFTDRGSEKVADLIAARLAPMIAARSARGTTGPIGKPAP